jgi:hypothetical protein
MLSAAKHLCAYRDRPFAEFTLSGANVLRVTRCGCSNCQVLFFKIEPYLKEYNSNGSPYISPIMLIEENATHHADRYKVNPCTLSLFKGFYYIIGGNSYFSGKVCPHKPFYFTRTMALQ